MLFVCGVAIWKVQISPCIPIMCQTPISIRNQTCHDGKHAGRSFCSALGLLSGSKGAKNVADALSRRDVAGSVWRFCRAAQFPVVGTAGAVAAGHREAFQRISIPGQGEDDAGDQGSAKVLTFDLSIPLLKRLISGSQSLYRQVQQDEHWASQCQLSVNDQGLVIKWGCCGPGSQLVECFGGIL
jgi:hypothetical protein